MTAWSTGATDGAGPGSGATRVGSWRSWRSRPRPVVLVVSWRRRRVLRFRPRFLPRNAPAQHTRLRSVVGQKGGSERWRNPAYRAVIIRESRKATTPRSSRAPDQSARTLREEQRGVVADTAMKPLPPCSGWPGCVPTPAGRRAAEGMRSMRTNWQVDPRHVDALPQREVPKRQAVGSAENCRTRAPVRSSPRQRKVISESANRRRISSAAACAARTRRTAPASGPGGPG